MKKTITETKVSRSQSHDRMSLRFTFPNSEKLNFTVSRFRDSISFTFNNDTPSHKEQVAIINSFFDWTSSKGSWSERFDFVVNSFKNLNSITEVVSFIKSIA